MWRTIHLTPARGRTVSAFRRRCLSALGFGSLFRIVGIAIETLKSHRINLYGRRPATASNSIRTHKEKLAAVGSKPRSPLVVGIEGYFVWLFLGAGRGNHVNIGRAARVRFCIAEPLSIRRPFRRRNISEARRIQLGEFLRRYVICARLLSEA